MRIGVALVSACFCLLASTPGLAEIRWAGNPIISLDAADLPTGELPTWENMVGEGGIFNLVSASGAAPEVRVVTPGTAGTAQQVVYFGGTTMMEWELKAPAGITLGGDWSMEAWVAREALTNGENVYFAWGRRCCDVAQFCNADWVSWVGWGGVPDSGWGGPRPPDDEFCHIAFTFDGSALRLYVNSRLRLTVAGANNVPVGDPVTVGGIYADDAGTLHQPFIGSIAKIRVHDGVLTEDDILDNYAAERDSFRPEDLPMLRIVAPRDDVVRFGKQDFDAGPSASVTVTIRSDGNVPLNFTGAKVTIVGLDAADFGHDASDFSVMPSGAERSFRVWADPVLDNEPKHAELVISTDAATVMAPREIIIPSGEFRLSLAVNSEAVYVDATNGDDDNVGSEAEPLKNLQTALDRVNKGGTITLAPGTYYVGREDCWSGQFLAVKAPEGATIVQEQWAWLFQGADAEVSFENVSFGGGAGMTGLSFFHYEDPGDSFNVSWTFKSCTWSMTNWWHGLCCQGDVNAAPTKMSFEDCTFDIGTPLWGAIYCRAPFDITMTRCVLNAVGGTQDVFRSNSEEAPNSSLTMVECVLNAGSERAVSVGGAGTTVAIDRCWFSRAELQQSKYGLELYNAGDTSVTNTVIEGTNSGMKCQKAPGQGATEIYNCTLVGTVDSVRTAGIELAGGAAANVSNCIVVGWNTPIQGANTGANNITDAAVTDPLFVQPNPFAPPETVGKSDYHLSPGSPAIDAGACAVGLDHDFDGKPRPTGTGCDIGAYEFAGESEPEICDNRLDDDLDGKTDCQDSDCTSAPNCQGGKQFRRGDADGKGGVPNITDGIFVLNFLFLGGPEPPCKEAANADDKGGINITDGIYILNYLFQGGPAPPAPGPDACGPEPADSQDDVGCEVYDKCVSP